jgi:hypothetical protein
MGTFGRNVVDGPAGPPAVQYSRMEVLLADSRQSCQQTMMLPTASSMETFG